MIDALIFIVALSLAILSLFSVAPFVISSVWEKEKRVAIIGGVIFWILLGGEIGLFALKAVGFFQSTLPHRLITELVARNQVARCIFLPLDDLFYGFSTVQNVRSIPRYSEKRQFLVSQGQSVPQNRSATDSEERLLPCTG